jgi:hypothetical protein
MLSGAHDLARVRDPAIELLLSHTATVTDEGCGRRRAGSSAAHNHATTHAELPSRVCDGRVLEVRVIDDDVRLVGRRHLVDVELFADGVPSGVQV